jgi:hypothetical protein
VEPTISPVEGPEVKAPPLWKRRGPVTIAFITVVLIGLAALVPPKLFLEGLPYTPAIAFVALGAVGLRYKDWNKYEHPVAARCALALLFAFGFLMGLNTWREKLAGREEKKKNNEAIATLTGTVNVTRTDVASNAERTGKSLQALSRDLSDFKDTVRADELRGKISAMTSDVEQTRALLYKQEFVRSVTLNVAPQGCIAPADLKTRSSVDVPLWADKLPDLFKNLAGRPPEPDETGVISLYVRYGGLWIVVLGQSNSSKERWFYSVGSDQVAPGNPAAAAPFPAEPNEPGRIMSLVDLRLSDSHIRQFVANPPPIRRILADRPFMTEQFDPREEMGFFRVLLAGAYRGAYDLEQLPPADLSTRPGWIAHAVPIEYLRCLEVRLTINDRLIANVVAPEVYFEPAIRERLLHWPGPMIDAKLQEGLVWLAPLPWDWKELRPLMNCRLAWLLYAESKMPCPR